MLDTARLHEGVRGADLLAVRSYVFDALTPEQAHALGEAAAHIVEAIDPPGVMRG